MNGPVDVSDIGEGERHVEHEQHVGGTQVHYQHVLGGQHHL